MGNVDGGAGKLSSTPQRRLAIVTCMDCRIDPLSALGIEVGEAHILRNAGGIITDDVIRSLVLSQRRLGTTDIAVVQHTDCGLSRLDERALRAEIRHDTGLDPAYAFGAFADVTASVRAGVDTLRRVLELPHRDNVQGWIYEVATGTVHAVTEAQPPTLGV